MPLKIIIIGAGIGGPAAAAALARQGHEVTVLERSTLEKQVGFAFRITANSDRCLKHLGIDTVQGGAVAAEKGRMMDGKTGQVWHEFGENQDKEKAKQATSVFAFRPQISKQLFDACEKLGVQIKVGILIKSIDLGKSQVFLEDGTTMNGDLIIGADGVNSIVRPHIVDETKHGPKPTLDQNCFRFMISRSAFETDDLLSDLYDDKVHLLSWKIGPLFMILYLVDSMKQYNVVCTHPAHLSDAFVNIDSGLDASSDYNQSVSRDDALKIYGDFEPRARRIFELADPSGFRIWKLQDMDEIPRWSNHNTILIGDAAHTVLPFSFSGASMAIEDGVFLAELLPKDTTREEIRAKLQLFEEMRKPRVGRVRDTGRLIGEGHNEAELVGPYRDFLQEYDTVEVAREALASHRS